MTDFHNFEQISQFFTKSRNCDQFFFVTLRTFFCLKIGGLERHNRHIREFYLIVINLAKRQSGKIFWKNTSNPNMRGSSTGVTSVTTNHRFSNNLQKISESESNINSRTCLGHLVLFVNPSLRAFESYFYPLFVWNNNVVWEADDFTY